MAPPGLDTLLQKEGLAGKRVAVIGPNMSVWEDPSPLYIASELERLGGSLTIIDKKPAWTMESHGNIHDYMEDFNAAKEQGVRAIDPVVKIADVLKRPYDGAFDIVFDRMTAKCILNREAAISKNHRFAPVAKRLARAYGQMTAIGGCIMLAYVSGYEDDGYSALFDALKADTSLDVGEPRPARDLFRIKNFGMIQKHERDSDATPMRPRGGTIRLGSGIDEFLVHTVRKVS